MKVIAEICQNSMGSRGLLERMIIASAAAGVDYVKSQSLRAVDLNFRERFEHGVFDGRRKISIKRPFMDEFLRLQKTNFTDSDHEFFVRCAKDNKLVPMTTIFSAERLNDMIAMGYESIKLASFDCSSFALQERILSEFEGKVFISTGGTFNEEVDHAFELNPPDRVTFLHCVSIYPTPLNLCRLGRIKELKCKYPNYEIGWSDHTNPDENGHKAAILAKKLGASHIERHFTLLSKSETKDGPVSVNQSQLEELCQIAKSDCAGQLPSTSIISEAEIELVMGCATYGALTEQEIVNRDYYVGRFISRTSQGVFYNDDPAGSDRDH